MQPTDLAYYAIEQSLKTFEPTDLFESKYGLSDRIRFQNNFKLEDVTIESGKTFGNCKPSQFSAQLNLNEII